MRDNIRLSRPISAAAGLSQFAEDHHRFVDKRVLVTGESSILTTPNGRECLLTALRLLIRICPHVTVNLPDGCGDLLEEVRAVIDPLAFGPPVTYQLGSVDLASFDATLCVGWMARPEVPLTVINSNGWLARVSSGRTSLASECGQSNPIGALAAASLGVGEVFKRLVRLKPMRGALLDNMSFSLYSYTTDEVDPGPAFPAGLKLDLLLAGAGAIGNGVIYLLTRLPVSGRIEVVDKQDYGDENLGTCILIGPEDVGKKKALFAEAVLGSRFDAKGFPEELSDAKRRLGKDIPYPRIIVGGVDNIDARHEIQKMWPDVAIDGATGDFMCQVSRHPWDEDTACLMCLFRQPSGVAAERVASLATGLTVARAQETDDIVSEADVLAAPQNRQAWLRERVGHPICSVIQEGVTQRLSDEHQREDFEPSVPFVACLSACMIISEVIKAAAGWNSPLEPRLQFDVLHGPRHAVPLGQIRRSDCLCVTRHSNIERLRLRRIAR